jgi:phosphoribosylformylglycinamidine cyclo-ligase
VFNKSIAKKYPECFDPSVPEELIFSGTKNLTDLIKINEDLSVTAGKLVLSPTRTYAPIISAFLKNGKEHINGIVHCSGGAQTKVLHFVDNVHIIKDSLFTIPPLFRMIKDESNTSWEEMYKVFNMGHRMEVYTDSLERAEELISIAKSFNVEAQIIGRVEKFSGKRVSLMSEHGTLVY